MRLRRHRRTRGGAVCRINVNGCGLQAANGDPSFFSQPKDPRLLKRLNWVLGCAKASAFIFQSFEDWKIKKFRAFVRVSKFREYYEQDGYFLWEDVTYGTKMVKAYSYPYDPDVFTWVEAPIEHCYYLGQYPLLWDTWWHTITSPANGTVSRTYPPSMGEGGLFHLVGIRETRYHVG